MRILCIHPTDSYNPGDQLTFLGAKFLFRQVGDNVEFLQFDMRRAEKEIDTYVPEYNWGDDIDVILLAGSPWLGEYNSKIRMVEQAVKRWADAKKIALGIGAFLSLGRMLTQNYEDVHTDVFKSFNLIVTRDIVAHNILSTAGIDNQMYYDTAIFSSHYLSSFKNKRKWKRARTIGLFKNVLIYYDPIMNDVIDHQPIDIWKRYIDFELSWASDNGADIIVVTSGDKASLDDKNILGKFATDLDWLFGIMSSANRVLSGRVHMAILATIAGCKNVSLFPVDSRYTTAVNCGVKVAQPINGLFPEVPVMPFNIKYRDKYAKYLIGLVRDVISNS